VNNTSNGNHGQTISIAIQPDDLNLLQVHHMFKQK